VDERGARISGLKELDRALGKADKTRRDGLRSWLREAADIAAVEAREVASSKGLRDSGDLISGIRPFALTGKAGVRSGAVHGGYAYPKRLEYEGRTGRRYGPNASLNPAVDRKEGEIIAKAEGLLDAIADDFNGGPSL
jgi:hypothetical protein